MLALVLALACTGEIGPGGTEPTLDPGDPRLPSNVDEDRWPDLDGDPAVVRRLTRAELDATIQDLLYDDTGWTPAASFPPEEAILGFRNNGPALTFPPAMAENALSVAEEIARRVVSDLSAHVDCTPSRACAETLAREFGLRAWRRPLDEDEIDQLLEVFDVATEPTRGIALVATVITASFPFYYRIEASAEDSDLTSYEIASRLSYGLIGSMPDARLLDLAADDALRDPTAVEDEARRLLDHPRARETVARFHREWLHLGDVLSINKDPETFPDWNNDLPVHLAEELDRVLDAVAWNEEMGRYRDLWTTTTSFLNEPLAAFYEVSAPAEEWGEVNLGSERTGLLTRGGWLAIHGFDQTSPVLRGQMVREHLLCDLIPPPPETVDNVAPPPAPDATTRERIEARTGGGSCGACHSLMNPVGFAFEGFDAAGQPRTEEGGKPIDATGSFAGTSIDAFDGPVELQRLVAQSELGRACFVRQWFRFINGRREGPADLEDLEALLRVMNESDGAYREVIVAVTQTDAFLTRSGASE
ncbi:MAG: DUF1592 domain-containing protein [Myxococcota bacterium]